MFLRSDLAVELLAVALLLLEHFRAPRLEAGEPPLEAPQSTAI
jgi:hypothetical protein